MLQIHHQVPHFEVTTTSGERVRYATIWQHRPLALVCLPDRNQGVGASGADDAYLASVAALGASADAAVVVTRDPIDGLTAPAALVADQWGEIFFLSSASSVEQLPPAAELDEWLRWVRMKCPECEGEAK